MHALRRTPHRRWLIGLALWVLVLAQGLGLAHRVRHALPTSAAAFSLASTPADAAADFGHDSDSVDCRLYDHLAHADLAGLPVAASVAEPTPEALQAPAPSAVLSTERWRAQARGPPAA